MNRLSRKSTEQLMELTLQQAYEMGFEDGQSSVNVEGNTIEHEGKLLRKVNREVREGDYIRPNKTVESVLKDGEIYGPVNEHQRILAFPVYAEQHNRTTETVEVFEVVSLPQIEKSANQQRAELIQKAKNFVEDVIKGHKTSIFLAKDEFEFKGRFLNVIFVVNEDKKTIVALLKGSSSNKVLFKGIAKCMPGDVFNEWIGKAIALARALEIDIPLEFLEAVQPKELVAGQVIEVDYHNNGIKHIRTMVKEDYEVDVYSNTPQYIKDNGSSYQILDDTNAQYEVS